MNKVLYRFIKKNILLLLLLLFGSRHEKLVRLALKQFFCCETRVRGQFVTNRSPVIFAGRSSLKSSKDKNKNSISTR